MGIDNALIFYYECIKLVISKTVLPLLFLKLFLMLLTSCCEILPTRELVPQWTSKSLFWSSSNHSFLWIWLSLIILCMRYGIFWCYSNRQASSSYKPKKCQRNKITNKSGVNCKWIALVEQHVNKHAYASFVPLHPLVYNGLARSIPAW